MAKDKRVHKGQLAIDFHQPVPFACSQCFAQISEKVHTYSLNRFHIALCWQCQKKYLAKLNGKSLRT